MIGVTAPAEKGKANDELRSTVAEVAGVGRSSVSVLRGATSRAKVLRIASAEASTLAERLRIIVQAK